MVGGRDHTTGRHRSSDLEGGGGSRCVNGSGGKQQAAEQSGSKSGFQGFFLVSHQNRADTGALDQCCPWSPRKCNLFDGATGGCSFSLVARPVFVTVVRNGRCLMARDRMVPHRWPKRPYSRGVARANRAAASERRLTCSFWKT